MSFDVGADAAPGAMGREDNIAHRAIVGYFVPWDLTHLPTTNDFEKKLGRGISSTHALAVLSVDDASNATRYIDGTQGKPLTSLRLFNPDGFMLRLYSPMGEDWPSVWEPRLVVEHKNKAQERTHRSTMIIDACSQQTWAWLQDLMWIKALGTPCDHEELRINGAGFPTILYPDTPSGTITRGALMLNVARNAGLVTDGTLCSALWHVLHLFGASGTQSGASDVCSFVGQTLLGLRGDVNFHVGSSIAHIAIGAGALTDGDPAAGWMWVGPPQPGPPATEMSTDASSNQPVLQRASPQGLRPIVFVPQRFDPVRTLATVPADYPAQPAGGPTTMPGSGTHGVFSVDTFATGVVRGYNTVVGIPESIPDGYGMDVACNFVTPAAGIGANSFDVQLDWCCVALQGSAVPAAVTGTSSKSLDSTTYAGNDMENRVMFRIQGTDLRGREGGKISLAFYRRGDTDRNGGTLDVVGLFTHFGLGVTRVS